MEHSPLAYLSCSGASKGPKFRYYLTAQFEDDSKLALTASYQDLFSFQCTLLDTYPWLKGTASSPRTLPMLPGKMLFSFRSRKSMSNKMAKRLEGIKSWAQGFENLPLEVRSSQEMHVFLFSMCQTILPAILTMKVHLGDQGHEKVLRIRQECIEICQDQNPDNIQHRFLANAIEGAQSLASGIEFTANGLKFKLFTSASQVSRLLAAFSKFLNDLSLLVDDLSQKQHHQSPEKELTMTHSISSPTLEIGRGAWHIPPSKSLSTPHLPNFVEYDEPPDDDDASRDSAHLVSDLEPDALHVNSLSSIEEFQEPDMKQTDVVTMHSLRPIPNQS